MMSGNQLKPNWKKVRFGDVVRQIKDRVTDLENCGLTEYTRGEHFESGNLHLIGRSKLGDGQHGSAFHMRFKPGDVLYVSRNPQLRKVAVADYEGICANTSYVLRANEEYLLQDLLPFVMQTEDFVEYTIQHKRGSTNFYLNFSDIEPYEFPLPPHDEQRGIADLLWAADDVKAASSNVLASISKLKASTRKENFSNRNDSKIRLKDLCELKGIQIGPFGSQLHASDYVSNGIPVVMPANMADDKIDDSEISRITPEMAESLSQHKVLPGDILLPRRGELDRRAFIYPEQEGWLCGTGSLRIRIKKGINPRAVFHALATGETVNWLKNHAVGTTMPNINATIVANIPISLPDNNKINEVVKTLEMMEETFAVTVSKQEADIKLKKELLKHYLG